MPFVTTPFTYKASINYILNSKPVANILHVTTMLGMTDSEMDDIANSIGNVWGASAMPSLNIQLVLQSVTLTDISIADGRQVTNLLAAPIPGGQGGDAVPNNVAGMITLRTGFTGRSKRGRLFIPGLAESNVSNNTPAPTVMADIVTALELVNAGIDAILPGAYLSIVSFFNAGVARPNGMTFPITSFEARTKLGTQRRRLP